MATFDKALLALKAGYFVTRTGWENKGMELGLHRDDEMVYMIEANGSKVPWNIKQVDILADDWEFVVDGG
jgi:hypothetical protein